MRNKLLISTAALLAGVAVASAQNMQGGGEQRGGAAQGQQSQPSPGSETQRGHDKQGQSQRGTQEQKQGQSQRGQKGETTGQAPQGQQEQGAQGQRDQGAQQDRGKQGQRDQSTGQTPQRQQGQQGQTGQGQGQTGQGQAQQGQAGQGQASGSVNLTTQQRTEIRQTVLTGGNVPRANNVNFALRAGTTVPTSVRVVEVPSALIEIYPQWRGHMYFVVGDQIIIVDRNNRIIAVLDV